MSYNADILGSDTIEFARKAARAGVDVRLRVEPGGFHVYVLSVPFIPEAVAAPGPQRSLRDGHS